MRDSLIALRDAVASDGFNIIYLADTLFRDRFGGDAGSRVADAYDGDIKSAMVLQELILGNRWRWNLGNAYHGPDIFARFYRNGWKENKGATAYGCADKPARALLIGIINAVISEIDFPA